MYRRIPKLRKYLYHYTSPSSFEKIMEWMSLRFNFYKKMNDPKESKYWSCSVKKEDVDKYIFNSNAVDKQKNLELYTSFNENRLKPFQNMKMKIQVMSFTTDNPDFVFGKDENNAYLYRGFGNPYFWAHYGNAQKGVCFQFDMEAIEKRFSNLTADYKFEGRKIKYSNEVFEGNPAFIRFADLRVKSIKDLVKDCIFENQEHYLFSKTTFWEPEREYRLALFNEIEEFSFLDITNCISSIIIGEDIEKKNEEKIISTAKKFKIAVAKMNWGNGYPTAVTISDYEAKYQYD
jgi:hypothetical protein